MSASRRDFNVQLARCDELSSTDYVDLDNAISICRAPGPGNSVLLFFDLAILTVVLVEKQLGESRG